MRRFMACFAIVFGSGCIAPAPAAEEGPRTGDVRDDNGLKLELVWCPPGTFTMGSAKSEDGHDDDEDEVPVTLDHGFWLGKTEVTRSQWKRVMGTEPWKNKKFVKEGPNFPANYVDWDGAAAFCLKLTAAERKAGRLPAGETYRLPTEAEWEYACRAGAKKKTRFSFGDRDRDLSDYAWWGGIVGDGNAKQEQYAHEVATRRPNPWGLFDMHGNVSEWCDDVYQTKLPGGTNPRVTAGGTRRVNRGGGWNGGAAYCRSAIRSGSEPPARYNGLGFRVARSSGE